MNCVWSQLVEIFCSLFDGDDFSSQVRPEMKTGDLPGWDSFKNVELLMACEELWGFQFSSREIDGMRTLGDVAACIEQKLAQ
jgi:acyl carrier protein